ncbi:MAG: T9SS type A sorting domain-containing protein [Ignavibacteriales bacterium]|nr:MAG: T9SS type A sorting domain-containing protein [Ignavibacteriales bacterium]
MKLLYFFFRIIFLLTIILLTVTAQFNYSQTWVRKVEGFSMWSIGKDFAGNIYAGTTGSARGIFKSTDAGESWTNIFSTGTSNYLGIACDSLNNIYAANSSNGMVYSTDGGQTFTLIPSSTFGNNTLNTVACGRSGHIFAGATTGGVWRSTDFGATFTNTALQTLSIVTIAVDKFNPDIIYAGASSTSANGFFISTDGGVTFGSSTNSVNVWDVLQTNSSELYIPTTLSPYPFTKSTDGGATWTTTANQPGAMRGGTLDIVDDIYISGNGGVFKSTDGGVSFANHNLTFSSNKILTYENKIMVCVTGTTNGGVYIFTDTQIPVELSSFTASVDNENVLIKWTTATELNNKGFEIERKNSSEPNWNAIGFVQGKGTSTQLQSYSFDDSHLPAGEYIYRLKQIDFDGSFEYSSQVEATVNSILSFKLEQNYPNPFNPHTVINFQIPNDGNVSLKVFDLLGNEIITLIDEHKTAGKHKVVFEAASLSSGVYVYRINAGSFSQSRKMLLIK